MSEAAYPVEVHRAAKRELDDLPDEYAADIKTILRDASQRRQPTSHPAFKHMKDVPGMLKLRVEGFRGLCDFESNTLRLLLVGKRRTVYDRVGVAQRRADDV